MNDRKLRKYSSVLFFTSIHQEKTLFPVENNGKMKRNMGEYTLLPVMDIEKSQNRLKVEANDEKIIIY